MRIISSSFCVFFSLRGIDSETPGSVEAGVGQLPELVSSNISYHGCPIFEVHVLSTREEKKK